MSDNDVSDPPTEEWRFKFDGDGVRVMEEYLNLNEADELVSRHHRYFFAGGSYEVKVSTSTTSKQYYAIGGMTVGMYDSASDELMYMASDHLTSASIIMDSSGNPLSEQRYMPFGEVRLDVGDTITETDLGYTGQLNYGDFGLMDYHARFYSPRLGRFVQADTIVPELGNSQAWDRYAYNINNPIRYIDPSGHGYCDSDFADPASCERKWNEDEGKIETVISDVEDLGPEWNPTWDCGGTQLLCDGFTVEKSTTQYGLESLFINDYIYSTDPVGVNTINALYLPDYDDFDWIPYIDLAVDSFGLIVDLTGFAMFFFPGILPVSAKLFAEAEAVATSIEFAWMMTKSEVDSSFNDFVDLAVLEAEVALDELSTFPGVGVIGSGFGIIIDVVKINQGMELIR